MVRMKATETSRSLVNKVGEEACVEAGCRAKGAASDTRITVS